MRHFVFEAGSTVGAVISLSLLGAPSWAAMIGGWVAVQLAMIELNTRKRPTP